MSSSPPVGSTNHSRGQETPPESRTQSGLRRLHSTLPWPQRATRLLGDWMGITILFFLWIAMLILVAHNVIIPRTCAQRWPLWVPLLGGMKSMLAATAPSRPECMSAALSDSAGSVWLSPATTATAGSSDSMTTYIIPEDALIIATALWAVAAMPLLLSFGAALISRWQQSPRARHRFHAEQERADGDWSERERSWKRDAADNISRLWLIESRHAAQAQHRMMQHACLYGFATSAIFAWGLLANNNSSLACQTRMMAIAAASAAFTSFSVSFGRLTVRASIRDTSARMFAYALRALILSVVSAVLLLSVLWHHGTSVAGSASDNILLLKDSAVLAAQPFKGPTSYMMLGMVVALIGEGVLSQLTARAASAVSLQMLQRGTDGTKELAAIDGLTEQDLLRLGEEGIDSIHALALASTASLYFGTPYTLQRLCDWQDQALLITYVGLAKAQMCREKLMVRGAIDLQRKADFLMCELTHPAVGDKEIQSRDKTFEIIRSSLGFISVEQARESLFPMANDEVIRRLRIYHRGSVTEDLRG